jgi:hypothetical protein
MQAKRMSESTVVGINCPISIFGRFLTKGRDDEAKRRVAEGLAEPRRPIRQKERATLVSAALHA